MKVYVVETGISYEMSVDAVYASLERAQAAYPGEVWYHTYPHIWSSRAGSEIVAITEYEVKEA